MSLYDDGIYAAPWTDRGAEYGPVSIRSGHMVSQWVAERDYHESIDGDGLWDHTLDAITRNKEVTRLGAEGKPVARHWSHLPQTRHDEKEIAAFVGNGARLTARQYEVYMRFWVGHSSYGQIARVMETSKKLVRECVQDIRRNARKAGSSGATR